MKKSSAKKFIMNEIRSFVKEQEEVKEKKLPTDKKERPDTEDEAAVELDAVDPDQPVQQVQVGASADITAIQQDLQNAFNKAKALGDEKLNKQVANTITYFTKTHVLGTGGADVEQVQEGEFNKMAKLAGIKKKLTEETADIEEGFTNYSIGGSDSAADLWYDVCESTVPTLTRGLKDPGNKYNTSGPQNVAMIIIEKFKDNIGPNLTRLSLKVIDLLEKDKSDNENKKLVSKLKQALDI